MPKKALMQRLVEAEMFITKAQHQILLQKNQAAGKLLRCKGKSIRDYIIRYWPDSLFTKSEKINMIEFILQQPLQPILLPYY